MLTDGSKVSEENKEDSVLKKINIFLSYCWGDSNEADRIYDYFKSSRNIELHRDTIDINKWGSIKLYMQSISGMDYAILLISDSYLKSSNCMYEVLEVMRDKNYRDKIFPAIICTEIFSPITRAKYVKYWQDEFTKLDNRLKEIYVQNLGKLNEDLKRLQDISSNVAAFLDVVSDMNNPQIEDVCMRIEEKLSRNGFFRNNWSGDEIGDTRKSGKVEGSSEITIRSRAEEYARKWHKNVFLNDFNEEDQNAGVNIKLSDIYIEECLPHYVWKTNSWPSDKLRNLLTKYIINNDEKKMLLILGQAGIGKSTLITWIMANLVENMEQILVYQFASDLGTVDWQSNNILDEIFNAIGYGYRQLEGKTLVLDGFDEIQINSDRERTLHKLKQELEKKIILKKFSLIITCRENYVEQSGLRNIEYITLQVWNEEQIKSFCEVYEKENAKKGSKEIDNINLEVRINKILENKQIFGIPLILYMVLTLNIDIEKRSSMVDIYDQIFSLKRGGIYDRNYDKEHRINSPEIKEHIHRISQWIAFWIFENNADKASIPQEKFKEICDIVMNEVKEKNEDIQRDVLIGNYFAPIKHCEGVGTDELQFVHRSIYEYFVVVYFFESICNLTSKEEVAGKLGELLRKGKLSGQILKFIKYKFDSMKRCNLSDVTRVIFNIMLKHGMTYYTKEREGNVIEQERNIFSNMLEVVRLWNSSLGKVNDKIAIYLQCNRENKLNLRGINLCNINLGVENLSIIDLRGAYLNEADLSEANLSGTDLEGAHLRRAYLNKTDLNGVNLNGADLRETGLIEADLRRADLSGADLREAGLIEADLRRADLSGADLSGANLREAGLSKANLGEACLREAYLSGADLRGAYLSGADLSKVRLSGADLNRAYLRKADLSEADLSGADLIGADLNEADLRGTDLNEVELKEGHLSGADLRGGHLRRADLREADLRGADLRGADLRGADLRGADLRGADLRRTDLIDADLRGIDLIGKDLNGAQLRRTLFDEKHIIEFCGKYNTNESRVYIFETNEIISYKEYCIRKQKKEYRDCYC